MFCSNLNVLLLITFVQISVCEDEKEEEKKLSLCYGSSFMCTPSLYCNYLNITHFEINCPNLERLKVLYLDNNQLTFRGNYSFQTFSALETLQLDNNRIELIKIKTFQNLKELKRLHLASNFIQWIEVNSFGSLPYLSFLDLDNNLLSSINYGIFVNCFNLLQVHLSSNKIEKIEDDSFIDTRNVKHFYAVQNQISDLKFIKYLNRLEFVNLSHNNLTKIRVNDLRHFKSVRYLDLAYNKLETLQTGTFSEMLPLSILNLSYNNLNYLGEGAFDNLAKLRELDLRNNSLRSFSYNRSFIDRNSRLAICIDNNKWCCDRIHEILNAKQIELIVHYKYYTNTHLNGIPCIDKSECYLEETTTIGITTKKITTTVTKRTTQATTPKNITETVPTTKTIVLAKAKFSTTMIPNKIKQSRMVINTNISTELLTNPFYVGLLSGVIILIVTLFVIVTILCHRISRIKFSSNPRNPNNDPGLTEDGYIKPKEIISRQGNSNFYVSLESYNEYEEIDENEDEHTYEEIY